MAGPGSGPGETGLGLALLGAVATLRHPIKLADGGDGPWCQNGAGPGFPWTDNGENNKAEWLEPPAEEEGLRRYVETIRERLLAA